MLYDIFKPFYWAKDKELLVTIELRKMFSVRASSDKDAIAESKRRGMTAPIIQLSEKQS
jgi:hypothetical protein